MLFLNYFYESFNSTQYILLTDLIESNFHKYGTIQFKKKIIIKNVWNIWNKIHSEKGPQGILDKVHKNKSASSCFLAWDHKLPTKSQINLKNL